MNLPTTLKDILLACERDVFCPECMGVSLWERKVPCLRCNGRGELLQADAHCNECCGRGVIIDSGRTTHECHSCKGYGVVSVECEACRSRGFTYSMQRCDQCNSDGTVPFSRTVLDNADHTYIMRLVGHMLHFSESDVKADLLVAEQILSLIESIVEDLPSVGRLDGHTLLAGIDDALLGSAREQIASRSEIIRQQELAAAQQERDKARVEQIREASVRQNAVNKIAAEMRGKYGEQ